jgi:ABC-type transport system involved in multi-copper enzyme maturation permease subunit
MSSAATTAQYPPALHGADDARPSLTRLAAVELRKMADTRAGLWLQISVALLTVLVVVITCVTGHAQDHSLRHIFDNAIQPAAVLLPIVGTLLVTSEWSQRTTLSTFALVPRRSRVIAAKLLASLAMTAVAFAVCLVVSLLGSALLVDAPAHGVGLTAAIVLQDFVYLAVAMLIGFALGAALLSSALAIVVYFALPTALGALESVLSSHAVTRWLDTGLSLDPLAMHALSAAEWARVGTTLALWIGLPLAVGVWRVLRSEIK